MKNLYLAGFLGLCLICTQFTNAQEAVTVRQHPKEKPLAFSKFPENISCNKSELEKLLSSQSGSSISISLNGDLQLQGIVKEKVVRQGGYSINLQLTNFPGSIFNVFVQTNKGAVNRILGRIINPWSGDVLILKESNQQYILQKQQQRHFMTE